MTDFTKQSKANSRPLNRPFILGVAGGSGSGKTYFARALHEALGESLCEIVLQDNFYFDQSKKFDYDGGSVNFDHPDSIDHLLLAQSLQQLKSGSSTQIPTYNFATHSRRSETHQVPAKPVIIVDGILIFHWPEVRSLLDDLIFFDTPEDLRFQRRLDRDVHERGRTEEGVRNQFYKQVKPMHDQFVQPSMKHAKAVVADLKGYRHCLDSYIQRLRD